MTATQLFAQKSARGEQNCFYCGGQCGEEFLAKKIVKPAFTGHDKVRCPASKYVCDGCVEAFSENTDIELINGEVRKSQRVRMYSWIITTNRRIAATKSHIVVLRGVCLSPPEIPFVIVLADSGQKHCVWLSQVNWDREHFMVNLEEETIRYTVPELKSRLELCDKLSAANGKVALKDEIGISFYRNTIEYYGNDSHALIQDFIGIQNEPLTRLAIWLAKNKEGAQNEYPRNIAVSDKKNDTRTIPAKTSRIAKKQSQPELFC